MRILALAGIVLAWTVWTLVYSAILVRRVRRVPTARNYRGVRLPMVLGFGLLFLGLWMIVFDGWFLDSLSRTDLTDRGMIVLSLFLVFLVGLFDDSRADPARGIGGHFRELAGGRVTPGVVKLVGIAGAATLVAVALSGDVVRILVGIPLVAGSANLWNLLDVRPGRALKWFLVVALVLVGPYARHDDFLLGAAIGSAAALLVLDLRGRAMLGDAGSNVLGFIIGIALFRVLPTWGLGIALAAILVLHVLAETVTLSRIIEATPPLWWFDRLGRLPVNQPEHEPRDSTTT